MTHLEFRPFLPGHLAVLQAQPAQQLEQVGMLEPHYVERLASNTAFGAWLGPRIVAAGGIVTLRPGEFAVGWCLFSSRAAPHMVAITRRAIAMLDEHPCTRIEMSVNANIPTGGRWAVALGFTLETPTPLRKRGVGGQDQMIYARVR